MKRVPTAGRHTSIQPLPLTSLPLAMTTIANARAELARAEHELKRMRASVEELEEEEKRKREEESEKRFQAAAHTIADALIEMLPGPLALKQRKNCNCMSLIRNFATGGCDCKLEDYVVAPSDFEAIAPLYRAVDAFHEAQKCCYGNIEFKKFLKLIEMVDEYNIRRDRAKVVEKVMIEKVHAKTTE